MAILCVHRQEPNWPEDIGRPRFMISYQGLDYWAETDGPEPTVADVALVIDPPPSKSEVHAERDRRLATVPFGGNVYQFDTDSQTNISGAGTLALAAIINGAKAGDYRWSDEDVDFYWLATDNTPTLMDAQTMFAFAQAAAAWKRDHVYAARVIKNMTPIPADYADAGRWPTA